MIVGHPVFWILAAAVLAPLLAEIPAGFRAPVVVLEIVLGILLGPHVLNFVTFDGFVATMFTFGMAMTLFMGGMDLDFAEIRGRPVVLAVEGWIASVLLAVFIIGALHVIPRVQAPIILGLAMCTTGLGVLVPGFRDSGQLGTSFGRFVLAAGTVGEVAPIVALPLLLSQHYSSWQEGGFLLAFLAIVVIAIAIGLRARPPTLLAILGRHMHTTSQLPVRISLFIAASLVLLAEKLGFEGILGAFAAGMILGQATRGEPGKKLRTTCRSSLLRTVLKLFWCH
jgi:Kef-type K+ transport system membrane component KefB